MENNNNIPTRTIESRTVSKKAEETSIQQKYTRIKSPEDDELLLKDSVNPVVKKTVKTYERKVIRKTGPNGEVTEEIIESGDTIPGSGIPMNDSTKDDSEKVVPKMYGKSEIQASYGMRTTLATGEEHNMEYSTGPMQLLHSNEVDHLYPVGASVTKNFQQQKTTTVTHSSTVNGESKVLSTKSTFLSVSGKSDLKIKSHEEDSIGIEGDQNDDLTENVEEKIEKIVRNYDQNVPPQQISQENNENINEIIEEAIIPTKHKQVKIELPNDGNYNMKKDELKEILNNLSKTLTFDDKFPKINVFDKQLLMEGNVKALEDLQMTPGILKKISNGRMLKFKLVLFEDLFVISLIKTSKKLKVIECCSTDMIKAAPHSVAGNVRSNFAKSNNVFSCASKSSPKKDITNHLFILKINLEVSNLITDPIILTAPTIENRDRWVSLISNAS